MSGFGLNIFCPEPDRTDLYFYYVVDDTDCTPVRIIEEDLPTKPNGYFGHYLRIRWTSDVFEAALFTLPDDVLVGSGSYTMPCDTPSIASPGGAVAFTVLSSSNHPYEATGNITVGPNEDFPDGFVDVSNIEVVPI